MLFPQNDQHFHFAGSELLLLSNFLCLDEADALEQGLAQEPGWLSHDIKIYGKTHSTPRLVQAWADEGVQYSYSGERLLPKNWPEALPKIKLRVEKACSQRFNYCLGNFYRDGMDRMGWHSDDESELGKDPVIASLSLGAERDFVLRDKRDHSNKMKLSLPHGSLLVMYSGLQARSQHYLPQRKRCHAARINLTFRRILSF